MQKKVFKKSCKKKLDSKFVRSSTIALFKTNKNMVPFKFLSKKKIPIQPTCSSVVSAHMQCVVAAAVSD